MNTPMHVSRSLLCMLGVIFMLHATLSQASEHVLTLAPVSKNAYYAEGVSALGSPLNKNFISNAGVVIGPTGVIVIDALGSPALGKQLIA